MHEYLMEVGHYFYGTKRFMATAKNREEAIEVGSQYIASLHDDNYIKGTVKVVRKLKPSFKDIFLNE